jgi:hypothetical protein
MTANRIFCAALAAITGRPVLPSQSAGGTTRGAACLVDLKRTPVHADDAPVPPLSFDRFPEYVRAWRALAGA